MDAQFRYLQHELGLHDKCITTVFIALDYGLLVLPTDQHQRT